jgi:hypothetical protein
VGTQDAVLRAGTAAVTLAAVVAAVRAARRRRRSWIEAGRYEWRTLTETCRLPVGREPVYWLLCDPPRAARLIAPDARVDQIDAGRWRLTLPGRQTGCTVALTGDVPEFMVAWTVPDGPLPLRGRAELRPAADGDTWLRVRVRYRWSRSRAQAAGIDEQAPARLLRQATDGLRAALRSAHAGG